MKEKFSKTKWKKFAIKTVKNDGAEVNEKDLEKFVLLMEKVINKFGSAESVLWESVNPTGTEDRTWVRTFLAVEGYKEYSDMLTGLDSSHAKRIVEYFKEAVKKPTQKQMIDHAVKIVFESHKELVSIVSGEEDTIHIEYIFHQILATMIADTHGKDNYQEYIKEVLEKISPN